MHTRPLLFLCLILPAVPGHAQTSDPQLPPVTVTAPRPVDNAASELHVPGYTLNERPVTRPGEVLEAAPGLIVVQHSGEGKANQYFLRGFNLDHGTDLAITFDGMPINMPTHAHGQGYADVNWLIPEMVDEVNIRKGPYYADEGDFSSAGALHVNYSDRLAKNLVATTMGSYGYWRGLAAASVPFGAGMLTGAGEVMLYNGPWDIPDAARKFNGFLRYSEGTQADGIAVTAMAYTNSWHSTDQIPARAVAEGIIDRFGTIDPTDGGDTQRYSLSARWGRSNATSAQRVEAYAIYSTLNLYNNFTYFLDNPVNGDQFQQSDKRFILGLKASNTAKHKFAGFDAETQVGLQVRYDNIQLGLFDTYLRTPLSTVLADHVNETSIGLYGQTSIKWNDWVSSNLGLRGDLFLASVDSNTPSNSGNAASFLPSPKLGLVFGPFADTRYFFNAGLGFHSNDARGATIAVDPLTGTPQQRVPLLVRSKGAEIGARTLAIKGLDSAIAFFILDFDSEIIFAGDAGTTEASRPSRRIGVEWSNRRPRLDASTLHQLRPGRELHSRRAGFRGQRRVEPRRRDGMVWRCPAALLRSAAPDREWRRREQSHDPRQRPPRLSLRERHPTPARRPQSFQYPGEPDRLLLRLATAQRERARQRHPLPSRRAARLAADADEVFLADPTVR